MQVNSPLTTCMVGVIKGIVTTVAGFFMVRRTEQQANSKRDEGTAPSASRLTKCSLCVSVCGQFQFGGQPITALNLTGVACNTAGGALYAWAKYLEKENKTVAPAAAAAVKLGSLPPHAHAHQDGDAPSGLGESDRLLLSSDAAFTRDRELELDPESRSSASP